MSLKAAFIFLSPDADPDRHSATIVTEAVELTVIGARDYAQADAAARDLVARGVGAIELCGGFGTAGAARIAKAVAGAAAVGVVRFDGHPGLNGASGDTVFAGD